jgi:hypothetical protein
MLSLSFIGVCLRKPLKQRFHNIYFFVKIRDFPQTIHPFFVNYPINQRKRFRNTENIFTLYDTQFQL